jgi:hypothetical protein
MNNERPTPIQFAGDYIKTSQGTAFLDKFRKFYGEVLRIESDYFGDMYACFLFSIPNFGRFALAQTWQPLYDAIVSLELELARPPHQMDINIMREKVAELRRIWFAQEI